MGTVTPQALPEPRGRILMTATHTGTWDCSPVSTCTHTHTLTSSHAHCTQCIPPTALGQPLSCTHIYSGCKAPTLTYTPPAAATHRSSSIPSLSCLCQASAGYRAWSSSWRTLGSLGSPPNLPTPLPQLCSVYGGLLH